MLARPRNGERGTHILLVGISTATMRKSVEISLKLEVHLSHDLAILLLSIYPKDKLYQRVICSTIFIAAPFTTGRIWNQSWCPWSIEWIKNMWYMYIHNGILFSYKTQWNSTVCSKMNASGRHHQWREMSWARHRKTNSTSSSLYVGALVQSSSWTLSGDH